MASNKTKASPAAAKKVESAMREGFAHDPDLERLDLLDEAWRARGHGRRLAAIADVAPTLRRRLAGGPRAIAVRTLPRAKLPYPTRFAFQSAALSPAPYVTIFHRTLLVQFLQRGAVKTLLFNPTDVEAAKATPYIARVVARVPERLVPILSPPCPSLVEQLAALGVAPEDVDYLAFDHFHTQDLRATLGRPGGARGLFPNAKLIAPACEWDDWSSLHPLQRAWYVDRGRDGVDASQVILTDGDLALGDGVMLLRTPGHTSGNQTLFVATSTGVWGCSENGTCADSWAPHASKIAGLRAHAQGFDVDLVMNLNTPEASCDQYASMSLERAIVDPLPRAPAFAQMFPSSEIVASALAPGLTPTITFGALTDGEVFTRRSAAAE
jgi:hypothetical protein